MSVVFENVIDSFEDGAARIVINDNSILEKVSVDGLFLNSKIENGKIIIDIKVGEGVEVEKPVHICFGALKNEVNQDILMNINLEEGASVNFYSDCVLISKEKILHKMKSNVVVSKNASFGYFEKHLHSDFGEIKIVSDVFIDAKDFSKVETNFNLIKGNFGDSKFFYNVNASEGASVNMNSKFSLVKNDSGELDEVVYLNGKGSSCVVKSRVAVRDESSMVVKNRVIAKEELCRGHIDCSEILLDKGKTLAYPEAIVLHPKARVTHEASLGGIDNKRMETLMARGLNEDEAEDLILEGMLR